MGIFVSVCRKARKEIKWIVGPLGFLAILLYLYNWNSTTGIAFRSRVVQKLPFEDKDSPPVAQQIIIPNFEHERYDAALWPPANYDVHVFYYAWYGTPKLDGKWYHWNHRFLPYWDAETNLRYPRGRHEPPVDIGASFYPSLGPYSSKDPDVIDMHMHQIRKARIGVVAVSWYPKGHADDEGLPPDPLIPLLLEYADKYDLKICFHIEPFDKRSPQTIKQAIEYIIDKYGSHNALYRKMRNDRNLPVFYIYDSYQIQAKEWNKVFGVLSEGTLRSTKYDGIFLGLVVEQEHLEELYEGGFDGMYTYFASDTFVFGSKPANWVKISTFCKKRMMLFVPSVGPGYDDTEVRRWNGKNKKDRADGRYYSTNFKLAMTSLPDIVTITSFNEWHEGTQIEPAVPYYRGYERYYLHYGENKTNMYLDLTRKLIDDMPSTIKQIDPFANS